MKDQDPKTPTKAQLAAMSDNKAVLKAHPENKVIGPPSDKNAQGLALDLSGD